MMGTWAWGGAKNTQDGVGNPVLVPSADQVLSSRYTKKSHVIIYIYKLKLCTY